MSIRLSAFLFAIALSILSGPVRAETATLLIEHFNTAFIEIVKDAEPSEKLDRYQKLNELVTENFNLPFMMKEATGSRWASARDSEKLSLVDAFLRISIGTYLVRFEEYSGEYFVVDREQNYPDGTTRVTTRLVRPQRPSLSVTYVTQKFDDDWRIVDLIFSGNISELAVRKSEFAGVLTQGGLPSLIARLNDQADKIIAQLPAPLRLNAVRETLN